MPVAVELKGFYSLDLPDGISTPDDPTNCWVRVNVDVGPTEDPGADTFRLVVCTPRALESRLGELPAMWGADLLIVPRFDWDEVQAVIEGLIHRIGRRSRDWDEFMRRFRRVASWEGDDNYGIS